MPVTIKPSDLAGKLFETAINEEPIANGAELLQFSCPKEHENVKNGRIFHSSFDKLSREDSIFECSNGFISGSVTAYNDHHHLILRPEDIWLAILVQLKCYINGHAEEVRHLFVDRTDKQELIIRGSTEVKGTGHFGVDWGLFSYKMSSFLSENIKDSSLRDWILPTFTTTTKADQAVASILMLASLQKYFGYRYYTFCGFPSITLLGQKEDWVTFEEKLERLPSFGDEVGEWYKLLKPVLGRFVRTFEDPESEETKEFWTKFAHYWSNGSGNNYLSGWITAFCYWSEEGESWAKTSKSQQRTGGVGLNREPEPQLELDGAKFHRVSTHDIPSGFASMPVEIDDMGVLYHAMLVAGSVGLRASSSGQMLEGGKEPGIDTVQPVSGWWIYEKKDDGEKEEDGNKMKEGECSTETEYDEEGESSEGTGYDEEDFIY